MSLSNWNECVIVFSMCVVIYKSVHLSIGITQTKISSIHFVVFFSTKILVSKKKFKFFFSSSKLKMRMKQCKQSEHFSCVDLFLSVVRIFCNSSFSNAIVMCAAETNDYWKRFEFFFLKTVFYRCLKCVTGKAAPIRCLHLLSFKTSDQVSL